MWIEETKTGKFKYVERYKDPLTNKVKRVSVVLDKNTAQTKNKANLILQEKIKEKLAQNSQTDLNFGELMHEFLKQWKMTVKEKTITTYKTVDKVIFQYIDSDILIKNINKRYARKILTKITEEQAPSIVKLLKVRLVQVFNYACEIELLHVNPFSNLKIKKPPEITDDKIKVVTADELKEMLESMRGKTIQRNIDITEFLFLTGLRIGELAALTKDDINYNDKTLRVNKTYNFNSKITTTPKTKASNRSVILSDRALEIIENNINDYTDLIFSNNQNKHISDRTYRRIISELTGVTPHVLRHSHISYLAENGIPIKAIMAQVGHSDPSITIKIYSHVTDKMVSDVQRALNKFAP